MEAPESPPNPSNSSSTQKISFSYDDMILEDSFTVENRKYLSFFLTIDTPVIVQCLRSEFLEYQNLYFDSLETQINDEACECDSCSPQFEEISSYEEDLKITLESGETQTQNFITPIYNIWNLVEGFTIGTCDLKV